MSSKGPSQVTLLIALVEKCKGMRLFHTRQQETYAEVVVNGHVETMLTGSRPFKNLLAKMYFDRMGTGVGGNAIRDALLTIDAKAREGMEEKVYTRLAEHDGYIWLDLADADWRAVRIGPKGWRVVKNPPVHFRRPLAMGELPEPVRGGETAELLPLVNVESSDFVLLVAWMVAALRPKGPYTILYLLGEHGSAKSTTERVVRRLVDPCRAELRTTPRDERDLVIAATNSQIVAIDNLSKLEPWLSDAICRIATGGGLSTRELYTDAEEITFDVQRPVLMNGIEELSVRGDFLDRALMLTCPVIPEYRRQEESVFWARFEEASLRLLGTLLDKVVLAMRELPNVNLESKPRMADFAMWSTAALGPNFMVAYSANVARANIVALESYPIVPYVRDLAVLGVKWTSKELLSRLNKSVDEGDVQQRAWPKTPHALAGQLRRLAPNLRKEGIEYARIKETDHSGSRYFTLTCRVSGTMSATSATSATMKTEGLSADDAADDVPLADDVNVSVAFERQHASHSKKKGC